MTGGGWRPALLVAGAGLLAWTGGAVLAGLAVDRLLARLGQLHQEAAAIQLHATRAVEHNAHEVVRVASLYIELRDWATVVGLLVSVADQRPARAGVPDGGPVPPPDSLALRFGAGRETTASSARLEAEGVRVLFEPGWLSRLYEASRDEAVATLQRAAASGSRSIARDPDVDVRGTTRRGLAELLEGGLGHRVWTSMARARLSAELAGQPVSELFPLVQTLDLAQVVGEPETTAPAPQELATAIFLGEILPATGDGVGPSSFTPSLWRASARASGAPQVRESVLWGSALPVPVRDGLRVRPLPSQIIEGAFVSVTLRLDVAGEIGHGQLTLFAGADDRGLPPPDAWDPVGAALATGDTDEEDMA
jgi:hypothetical protein